MQIKIEKNDDGFLAQCPEIKGAFAEGNTEFEAFYNLIDVINLIAEYKTSFRLSTHPHPLSLKKEGCLQA